MTIPTEIYTRLSASERIRAAVSALARNDDSELQTLKETCPKKSFLMNDPAYSEGIQRLLSLALAVESDLERMTLDFFIAARLKGLEGLEAVDGIIGAAASLESAWGEFLTELGIPRREMKEAGPPRHHAVEAILNIGTGEEDAAAVQIYLETMREAFAA